MRTGAVLNGARMDSLEVARTRMQEKQRAESRVESQVESLQRVERTMLHPAFSCTRPRGTSSLSIFEVSINSFTVY